MGNRLEVWQALSKDALAALQQKFSGGAILHRREFVDAVCESIGSGTDLRQAAGLLFDRIDADGSGSLKYGRVIVGVGCCSC